jgi:hypothetical protein
MIDRLWIAAAAGAVLVATAFGESRFPVEQRETVRRTLQLAPGASRTLEVSNINGSITVVGGASDRIELVAERAIRGRTEADVQEGKRLARLEASETAGGVLVCGDTSHRCRCDEPIERNERRTRRDDPPYRVDTRFELHVPRAIALRLCTVNGGAVTVSHTSGELVVTHVNGRIEASDVRGTARLTTVNGSVKADFAELPAGPSSFRSVNGDVVVSLPDSLSADLRLKTMNGGLFTDFETTSLPATPATAERRNGRLVYRSNRTVGVRVGRGGPELSFETLNGDVRVLKR